MRKPGPAIQNFKLRKENDEYVNFSLIQGFHFSGSSWVAETITSNRGFVQHGGQIVLLKKNHG
jgi:hypothetical protein